MSAGYYENLGEINYFIPNSLYKIEPSVYLNDEVMYLYGEVVANLSKVNTLINIIPSTLTYIKLYNAIEVSSSLSIEGVEINFLDIIKELPNDKNEQISTDMQLAFNYLKAININSYQKDLENNEIQFQSTIKNSNKIVNFNINNEFKTGEYRKKSIRIADFIPAPAVKITQLMDELESYLREKNSLPLILKIAVVTAQIELIYPFIINNGYTTRIITLLMLVNFKILELPIISPSFFFNNNQESYYKKIRELYLTGNFKNWILYFLNVINTAAIDAYKSIINVVELKNSIISHINTDKNFYKMRQTALNVLEIIFEFPIINVQELRKRLGKAYNTAEHLIQQFLNCEILFQGNQQKRNKIYHFNPYLQLILKQ